MKTYILRSLKTVEPQKPLPAPITPVGPALFIGLDVHNESIAVSLAPSDAPEVRRYGIISGHHVLKLIKNLPPRIRARP